MNDDKKDPVDRMVAAYEEMLGRIHEAAETTEKKTVPWLRDALGNARERAVELNELTREEAERISRYVERDIHEAASFLADTGQEFRDWVNFDLRLIQSRMLDMFAGMADQTSQAIRQFAEQARAASEYRAGEVMAPGLLECTVCGETVELERTGVIPACPKCKATTFRRKVADTGT
jgi:predicted RNA-binding Zn-ribbon protein involved in translation (DUF1610 family)